MAPIFDGTVGECVHHPESSRSTSLDGELHKEGQLCLDSSLLCPQCSARGLAFSRCSINVDRRKEKRKAGGRNALSKNLNK